MADTTGTSEGTNAFTYLSGWITNFLVDRVRETALCALLSFVNLDIE
jgi:hypothetical protein